MPSADAGGVKRRRTSCKTTFQKVHFISRQANINTLDGGPRKLPKFTRLCTPARLSTELGANINICECTSQICIQAKANRFLVHVRGSRRLCGQSSDAHEECALLRAMMKKYIVDRPRSDREEDLPTMAAESFKLNNGNVAAFLLHGTQVVGYISLVAAVEHNLKVNVPDVPETLQKIARSSSPTLPLLRQIFVEDEYRRKGVCTDALDKAFKDKHAILVDDPTVPVAKSLQHLGFICVGAGYFVERDAAGRCVQHPRGLYVRSCTSLAAATAGA